MSRQWVRLGCLIIMLLVAIPSGYHLFRTEQRGVANQESAAAFDALAWTLSLAVAKLESAQIAYVASGQNGERWFDVVDRQVEIVGGGLKELAAMARSGEALESLSAAEITVDRLRGIDEIARELTATGETLMASDVVFADGRELALRATTELAAARSSEQAFRTDLEQQYQRTQITTWSFATAVSIGIVLLLAPVTRRSRPQDPRAATTAAGSDDDLELAVDAVTAEMIAPHSLEFDVESLDPDVDASPALLVADDRPLTEPPPPPAPELSELARVCTDLGCVSEESDLNDALGQVAALLNASALAVWVNDARGTGLRPVAGHGFAPDVLRRLGTLTTDDDNITAAAYRTHRVQIAAAQGDHLGAIAAPLITTSSRGITCNGVLSVEVRDGWETRAAVQSTAAILAAQLGTLVVVDSVGGTSRPDVPSQALG